MPSTEVTDFPKERETRICWRAAGSSSSVMHETPTRFEKRPLQDVVEGRRARNSLRPHAQQYVLICRTVDEASGHHSRHVQGACTSACVNR
jgi:hypothetical protein